MEADGFEPPRFLQNGFTARRLQPLGHASKIHISLRPALGFRGSHATSTSGRDPGAPICKLSKFIEHRIRQGTRLHFPTFYPFLKTGQVSGKQLGTTKVPPRRGMAFVDAVINPVAFVLLASNPMIDELSTWFYRTA